MAKRRRKKGRKKATGSLAALKRTVANHSKRLGSLEHFRSRQTKLNGLMVRAIRGLRGGLRRKAA